MTLADRGTTPALGGTFSARLDQRACYEIKFSDRYRGFACVLFKLWQVSTLRNKGAWAVMRADCRCVKPRALNQASHAPGTAMHLAGMDVQALGRSGAVGVAYTWHTPSEMKQLMPGTIKLRQQGPSYTTHTCLWQSYTPPTHRLICIHQGLMHTGSHLNEASALTVDCHTSLCIHSQR